jgi:DNA helicase-2/ATP-dependent DNA helicase PcrA
LTVPDLADLAATYSGAGCVVAPAGFGKTHLIAASVQRAERRQLVLTHTYAGVNALRRRLRRLKVPERLFEVDTIASWALRLCLSYPESAHWAVTRPNDSQWTALYAACSSLVDQGFVKRILQASYGGIYIDEYQDCSIAQHGIALKLAQQMPCRVLGDPLQSIFDFDGDPIDWNRDVGSAFTCIGQLDVPHRWQRAGSPRLGEWLRDVRGRLECGAAIVLGDEARAAGIDVRVVEANDRALIQSQLSCCRGVTCGPRETVAGIHGGSATFKAKCHRLSRNLGGMYSSIEEIEGKDVFSFIQKLERARTPQAALKHAVALAAQAMTNVKSSLSAGTVRGETVSVRSGTKNAAAAMAGNAYLTVPSSATLATFLEAVKKCSNIHLVRADLFNRVVGTLKKHALTPHIPLLDVADRYQSQYRHRGRQLGRRRIVSTTLLVKGLEFDHAIVLDASSLSRRELYVALTRGAKSLTIISSTQTVTAAP